MALLRARHLALLALLVRRVYSKHSCKSSTFCAFSPIPLGGMELGAHFHCVDRALSPHELAYQETLVQEREVEIREIETGIHELNEITRDLATIITEQGTMIGESSYPNPFLITFCVAMFPSFCSTPYIVSGFQQQLTASSTDNIESNISSVEVHTREANRELTTAADYQSKAGRRGAWLMIIIAVVVTIVLIAVRVLLFVLRHMYL